jgi:hypothetical protein
MLFCCLPTAPMTGLAEEALTAREIVRRSDDLSRRSESFAVFTMNIERPDWTRTLVMEGWTQGTSNTFIRILSPKKEKDVTFLKRRREAWQYVPSVDRTIKIPPSMMLQSWMGSDLTNDDIVRADSMVVDYDHAITGEPEEDGIAYWVIEAIPKPEAPVVWGKVVLMIRKQDFVADRADYYDEDGELMKYYRTFDIQRIEGHDVATRFTMYDLTNPGYSTTLIYDEMTFSPDMKPGMFSVRSLKR